MSDRKKDSGSGSFIGGLILGGLVVGGVALLSKIFSKSPQKKSSARSNLSQSRQYQPVKFEKKPDPIMKKQEEVGMTAVDSEDKMHQLMICPITQQLMRDPTMVAKCGHSFERTAIVACIERRGECPMCRTKIRNQDLVPNYQLKSIIQCYKTTKQ